jgi:hypothetical protein
VDRRNGHAGRRGLLPFDVEPEEEVEEVIDEEQLRLMEVLNHSVEELELSVRSSNCLRDAGIRTLGDLVRKSEAEMLKYRNFGRKSLQELVDILSDMGLHFGMDVEAIMTPGGGEEPEAAGEEPSESAVAALVAALAGEMESEAAEQPAEETAADEGIDDDDDAL